MPVVSSRPFIYVLDLKSPLDIKRPLDNEGPYEAQLGPNINSLSLSLSLFLALTHSLTHTHSLSLSLSLTHTHTLPTAFEAVGAGGEQAALDVHLPRLLQHLRHLPTQRFTINWSLLSTEYEFYYQINTCGWMSSTIKSKPRVDLEIKLVFSS